MQISYPGTPNMEKGKKHQLLQLCSSLATKITQLDESMIEKSNMLFSIREQTMNLVDQQKQIQNEIKSLVEQQGEILKEFANLYEIIEESSDAHGMLGDKPTYSGESTKNKNVEFKSAYDDSTVHMENLENINIKTNNEQPSSSDAGKNKVFRIKGSFDSKNINEKEYYEFALQVYNLNNGDTFFRLEGSSIYPRITTIEGVSAKFLYQLFKFGFCDRIYPSLELKEFQFFDPIFVQSLEKYAEGKKLFIRVYNIAPEYDEIEEYPCFNLVHIAKLKGDVSLRVNEQKLKIHFFNKKWEQYRRWASKLLQE